ncbi:MAG: hypothetical protein KC621_17800 [Myxococcales bacterium]|nr:hypothetical protein [Myxococcales bacterium]
MDEVPIQLAMFGAPSEVVGLHVVSAHTRQLANGNEVFVGEHVRWNRGQRAPRENSTPHHDPPAAGQLVLF